MHLSACRARSKVPVPACPCPAQPAAAAQQQTGWLTYEDPLGKFTLSYPENWNREDMENGVRFHMPEHHTTWFRFTTTSTTEELGAPPPAGTPLPTAKSVLRNLSDLEREMLTDYRVISRNSTTELGGLRDVEQEVISYTYEPVTMDNDISYTRTMIVAVQDSENIYEVAFQAETLDYPMVLPTFEKMVESVEITN
jgi:hypothetical protein